MDKIIHKKCKILLYFFVQVKKICFICKKMMQNLIPKVLCVENKLNE